MMRLTLAVLLFGSLLLIPFFVVTPVTAHSRSGDGKSSEDDSSDDSNGSATIIVNGDRWRVSKFAVRNEFFTRLLRALDTRSHRVLKKYLIRASTESDLLEQLTAAAESDSENSSIYKLILRQIKSRSVIHSTATITINGRSFKLPNGIDVQLLMKFVTSLLADDDNGDGESLEAIIRVLSESKPDQTSEELIALLSDALKKAGGNSNTQTTWRNISGQLMKPSGGNTVTVVSSGDSSSSPSQGGGSSGDGGGGGSSSGGGGSSGASGGGGAARSGGMPRGIGACGCGYTNVIIPLKRSYNSQVIDHLYTTDVKEWYSAESIWKYAHEGEAGYLGLTTDVPCGCAISIFRHFNAQVSDHFYTTDPNESAWVPTIGYALEGVIGYCVPAAGECGATVPLWRFYYAEGHDHFYTNNQTEAKLITSNPNHPYKLENIMCYVWPSTNGKEQCPAY